MWVTTDCQGVPEVAFGYAVLMMSVLVVRWYECGDPPVPCPVYAYSPRMEIGFTAATEWEMEPAPPEWGVDIYWVDAMDEFGNTLDECETP